MFRRSANKPFFFHETLPSGFKIMILLLLSVILGVIPIYTTPCDILFPKDLLASKKQYPVPLAIQLKPTESVISNWNTSWEMFSNDNHIPVALFQIKVNKSNATIYLGNIENGQTQSIFLKNFILSKSNWDNYFTFFIKPFTISLNQGERVTLALNHSDIQSIRLLNMSRGGPMIAFPPITEMKREKDNEEEEDGCMGLLNCNDNWTYASFEPSDLIYVIPKTKKRLLLKVVYSFCFPNYNIGIYIGDLDTIARINVSYWRDLRYHSLSVKIDDNLVTLITREHSGLDCSNDWYLLAIRDAIVVPNCRVRQTEKNTSKGLLVIPSWLKGLISGIVVIVLFILLFSMRS